MAGPAHKPRIIVADDYRAMREELSRLLQCDFDVVATAPDGPLAIKHVADFEPDAVVLDVHLAGIPAIEVAHQIKQLGSSTKIIFITIAIDPEYIRLATAMNASYVLKRRMRRDLVIAI